ncbi:MAG: sigma-70 family RNA polymerase sigma factor [Pseudomonadota bacterium]
MTADQSTTDQAATDLVLPRIAGGDESAVQDCLDRFGGLVWSLARRMCRNQQEAEDAVQDIFVEVWKNAGRYKAELASEATFVAMIARRRLIDRRRKDARTPDNTALPEGTPDRGSGIVGSALGESEDVEMAREVLTHLTQDQQRVLQLAIFYGLSHEKISQSTGLPLGTVKTHARRGLIRVRQLINKRREERALDARASGGVDGAEGGAA